MIGGGTPNWLLIAQECLTISHPWEVFFNDFFWWMVHDRWFFEKLVQLHRCFFSKIVENHRSPSLNTNGPRKKHLNEQRVPAKEHGVVHKQWVPLNHDRFMFINVEANHLWPVHSLWTNPHGGLTAGSFYRKAGWPRSWTSATASWNRFLVLMLGCGRFMAAKKHKFEDCLFY